MNKKYAFAILLLVIAALAFVGMQRNGEPKITVLNPAIESKMVDREPSEETAAHPPAVTESKA